MQLVDSVWIPQQYYPQASDFVEIQNSNDGHGNKLYTPIEVYDMWCSLEVDVTTTSTASYNSNAVYAGVETTTNGYYAFVNSGNDINIYVTNNTKQDITNITLSNLVVATKDAEAKAGLMDRDCIDETKNFAYKLKMIGSETINTYNTNGGSEFSSKSVEVLIRPNETILLCTITDVADANHSNYIISRYNVTASLKAGAENSPVDIIKNINTATGSLVNDSEYYYEFRIVNSGTANISSKITNCNLDYETITVSNKTYYYYKGVICPGQCITILTNLETTANVDIELFKHMANGNPDYYVEANYAEWNTNNELSEDWLQSMKNIYSAPNFN